MDKKTYALHVIAEQVRALRVARLEGNKRAEHEFLTRIEREINIALDYRREEIPA